MGLWKNLSFYLISCAAAFGNAQEPLNKNHLLFLMKNKKIVESIEGYKRHAESLKKHDSELLEQMSLILLESSMQSREEDLEMLTLYGASLAGISSLLDFCEKGVKSRHPRTQLVSIQLAGQIPDDSVNAILCKAFASDFFPIRMEAAAALASRKYKHATGYIESLMAKIHPAYHCFFSNMFAAIGSHDAIYVLKKMIHAQELYTRVSAILSAAQFSRDDLIKDIKAASTHLNPAEQEACCFALGSLCDSSSIPLLEKLALSQEKEVAYAASFALISFGKKEYLEKLLEGAKQHNLFAISLLGNFQEAQQLLCQLVEVKDKQIKFNAALALLQLKNKRCLPIIQELLLSNSHDLAFLPAHSTGKSMVYWKCLPSLSVLSQTEQGESLLAVSLALRENLLAQLLEFGDEEFLKISENLIKFQQKDLIPFLVELLCNIHSDKVIEFLKQKAEELGRPFTRNYAALALAKLKVEGGYQERVISWIQAQKDIEIIQFRPITSKVKSETSFAYKLTPKETSAFLIEALSLISSLHEEKSLDLLLEMIKNGHPKNRPILAGLLIKTLE